MNTKYRFTTQMLQLQAIQELVHKMHIQKGLQF